MKDQNGNGEGHFECVEPEIGALMWQRNDPDLNTEMKDHLADHLLICSSCKLDFLVNDRIVVGIKAGELKLKNSRATESVDGHFQKGWRVATFSSGLALAASLILMFMLPPASMVPSELRRGQGAGKGMLRPVEGEIFLTANPSLSWSPVAGATAYQVEISEEDGPWSWTGQTDQPHLTLPVTESLPNPGRFRALVAPIPADLAGLVDMSVYFQRSGLRSFFAYRVAASPFWVRGLAWLGLACLGWALLLRLRGRRQIG